MEHVRPVMRAVWSRPPPISSTMSCRRFPCGNGCSPFRSASDPSCTTTPRSPALYYASFYAPFAPRSEMRAREPVPVPTSALSRSFTGTARSVVRLVSERSLSFPRLCHRRHVLRGSRGLGPVPRGHPSHGLRLGRAPAHDSPPRAPLLPLPQSARTPRHRRHAHLAGLWRVQHRCLRPHPGP